MSKIKILTLLIVMGIASLFITTVNASALGNVEDLINATMQYMNESQAKGRRYGNGTNPNVPPGNQCMTNDGRKQFGYTIPYDGECVQCMGLVYAGLFRIGYEYHANEGANGAGGWFQGPGDRANFRVWLKNKYGWSESRDPSAIKRGSVVMLDRGHGYIAYGPVSNGIVQALDFGQQSRINAGSALTARAVANDGAMSVYNMPNSLANGPSTGITPPSGGSTGGGNTGGGGSSGGNAPGSGTTRPEPKPFELNEPEKQCTSSILSEWCDNSTNNPEQGIADIIQFVIELLSIGVGVIGTAGIIIGGFTIMTASSNSSQVEAGIRRIQNTVIGISLFALMSLITTLFIP